MLRHHKAKTTLFFTSREQVRKGGSWSRVVLRNHKYTLMLLRSPHANKNAQEHFRYTYYKVITQSVSRPTTAQFAQRTTAKTINFVTVF